MANFKTYKEANAKLVKASLEVVEKLLKATKLGFWTDVDPSELRKLADNIEKMQRNEFESILED